MQDVLRSGIDWDTKENETERAHFQLLLTKLRELKMSIPRCYCVGLSEQADRAYFRIKTASGIIISSLVGAESKVVPLKLLSIPRLELQAAVLGTWLAGSIRASHTVKMKRQIFWSDSMNVLSWVRSTKKRYKTFVALGIGELLESSRDDVFGSGLTAIQTTP